MVKTSKRIYILGICGVFMASIAVLAKQMDYCVTGCDKNVYPPIDNYLASQDISFQLDFDLDHLISQKPDLIIVGNSISRGNLLLEYILAQGLTYMSGPSWLARYVLAKRTVIAVAGTHGKTTTTSMIAWILTYANQHNQAMTKPSPLPGFLIGGIAMNFNASAYLGHSPYFVIEADEYDSSFADKRSKFVHYKPKICVLSSLEFDHADIFADLSSIKQQFHHLIRTIPANGHVVANGLDANLADMLAMGCWTPITKLHIGKGWQVKKMSLDASHFSVWQNQQIQGEICWQLLGEHNMKNALSAIVATQCAGVKPELAIEALQSFKGVRRRLEKKPSFADISFYDDFAHHPTAIKQTLQGLQNHLKLQKKPTHLIAIIDLASYSMRHHVYGDEVIKAASIADKFMIKSPQTTDDCVINFLLKQTKGGDCVIFMGNKSFDKIYDKFKMAKLSM